MWRKLFGNIKKKLNIVRSNQSQKYLDEIYDCHYTKTSGAYHLIAISLLFITAIFVIVALVLNIKNITYDNFYYFFKDFDTILTSEDYSSFSVEYSYENYRSYTEYKGGFATIGQSSLTVYSATGQRTGRFYHKYSSPEISGSSKYLAVYDRGGNDFAIYNSFARLYGETVATPIYLMEICDNGDFAVITSTDEYRSVVYFYNQNFKRIGAYYYTSHVTAVSLSDDGKYMLVALADTENGAVSTKILLYRTEDVKLYEDGKKEAEVIVTDNNALIVTCGIDTSGGASYKNKYYYLDIGGVSILNAKSKLHRYDFGVDSYLCYAVDDEGIAVVVENKNRYIMYVESGLWGDFDIHLESKPTAVEKYGKYIFILYSDCVVRYDIKACIYQKLDCADGAEDIIISADDSVIVCYPSRAINLDF